MRINIPKKIENEFLNFLDLAQSSYSQEEIKQMSQAERECIMWVDNFLGKKASKRFETKKQQKDAARAFYAMLK
jgi:hypothetical protein